MVHDNKGGRVSEAQVSSAIVVVRGQKVLLDTELAALYGLTPKRLNEQVRRNQTRFPADFMFKISSEEAAALRSQFATIEVGRGKHRKYPPYAFTEHGPIMVASVLNSPRTIEMSVFVVRAFVKLREMLANNRELARRFAELEARLDRKVAGQDLKIAQILEAIRALMAPVTKGKRGTPWLAAGVVGAGMPNRYEINAVDSRRGGSQSGRPRGWIAVR